MTIKPVAWQATEAGQFHYTQDAGKAMEWANAGIVLTPLCCSNEAMAEIGRLQSELQSLKNMSEKEHKMPNLEAVMQFGEYGKPSRALCYQDEALAEIGRLRAENAELRRQLAEARDKALDDAASSVEAVAHEGLHASMWRNKFERVAETIRLMKQTHNEQGVVKLLSLPYNDENLRKYQSANECARGMAPFHHNGSRWRITKIDVATGNDGAMCDIYGVPYE